MEWLTPAATLVASFGGFWLAGVNETRGDRRQAERERAAEARAAQVRSAEQRHKFQLETLLELQDQIQKMTRLNGRTLLFDHAQARAGGLTQLPEGLNQELFENGVTVRRLTARVLEDEVRDAVEEFSRHCTAIALPFALKGLEGAELEAFSDRQIQELSAAVERVMEVMGRHIREALTWEGAASSGMSP